MGAADRIYTVIIVAQMFLLAFVYHERRLGGGISVSSALSSFSSPAPPSSPPAPCVCTCKCDPCDAACGGGDAAREPAAPALERMELHEALAAALEAEGVRFWATDFTLLQCMGSEETREALAGEGGETELAVMAEDEAGVRKAMGRLAGRAEAEWYGTSGEGAQARLSSPEGTAARVTFFHEARNALWHRHWWAGGRTSTMYLYDKPLALGDEPRALSCGFSGGRPLRARVPAAPGAYLAQRFGGDWETRAWSRQALVTVERNEFSVSAGRTRPAVARGVPGHANIAWECNREEGREWVRRHASKRLHSYDVAESERVYTEALAAVDARLGRLGVPYFLMAGGILGWARECAFPAASGDDFDVGVFVEDRKEGVIEALTGGPDAPLSLFHEFGTEEDGLEYSFWLRRPAKPRRKFDIFFFYRNHKGRPRKYWYSANSIDEKSPRRHMLQRPFRLVWTLFMGHRMLMPDAPVSYAEMDYGPDWYHPPKGKYHWLYSRHNLEACDKRQYCYPKCAVPCEGQPGWDQVYLDDGGDG